LDEPGDHEASILARDGTGNAPLIGLKAEGYLDISQLPLEALDFFIVLGHEVLLCQDSLLSLSKLLGKLVSVVMDGGDEAIGSGMDSVAEVLLLEE